MPAIRRKRKIPSNEELIEQYWRECPLVAKGILYSLSTNLCSSNYMSNGGTNTSIDYQGLKFIIGVADHSCKEVVERNKDLVATAQSIVFSNLIPLILEDSVYMSRRDMYIRVVLEYLLNNPRLFRQEKRKIHFFAKGIHFQMKHRDRTTWSIYDKDWIKLCVAAGYWAGVKIEYKDVRSEVFLHLARKHNKAFLKKAPESQSFVALARCIPASESESRNVLVEMAMQ